MPLSNFLDDKNEISKKLFFLRNKILIDALVPYAPTDDQLLSIPPTFMANNPFLLWFLKNEDNKGRNNYLIGSNLYNFLSSLNQILSRVYAAYNYIVRSCNTNCSTQENPEALLLNSLIFCDYSVYSKLFISNLKIIIDHIFLIWKKYESIGSFLKKGGKKTKFLVVLNSAANSIKHQINQFESVNQMIKREKPAFPIILEKKIKKEKYDIENLKELFNNPHNECEKFVLYFIEFECFVKGFNSFKEDLIKF